MAQSTRQMAKAARSATLLVPMHWQWREPKTFIRLVRQLLLIILPLTFVLTVPHAPAIPVRASLAPCGYGYVFRKADAAFGYGHVAYGIAYGSNYILGSTDGAGKNAANVFTAGYSGTSDAGMLDIMRGRGYNDYKVLPAFSCNFDLAQSRITTTQRTPYDWLQANCQDATIYVLSGFGVTDMPTSLFIAGGQEVPNTWFDSYLPGDSHPL